MVDPWCSVYCESIFVCIDISRDVLFYSVVLCSIFHLDRVDPSIWCMMRVSLELFRRFTLHVKIKNPSFESMTSIVKVSLLYI